MTCAIISSPREQRAFVTQDFYVHDVVTGGDRVYALTFVDRRDADVKFTDPLDGALLVECRYFDDEPAARRWVASDIALRTAQPQGVQ